MIVSCTAAPPPTPDPGEPGIVWLSERERLIRISMILRGLRPEPEAIEAVLDDPGALEGLVETWLSSEAFGATVRDMHNAQLALRDSSGGSGQLPAVGPLQGWSQAELDTARGEAPLKLVEAIVLEGHPYSEIVTADWMMADPITAAAYGVPYDPEGPRWQRSAWIDGRPRAGLLSSTQLYRRHLAEAQDFNRSRANLLARVLLCDAISDRPLDISAVELPLWDDPSTVANALDTVETCVNCHQSLDPLASTLFGFKRSLYSKDIERAYEQGCVHAPVPAPPEDGLVYGDDACYPLRIHRPENESLYLDFGLRPPGFYGQPVEDLEDLGEAIAGDDRFVTCTVRRFTGYLTQTHPDDLPESVISPLEASFRASGLDARQLVREIVLSDEVRILRAPPDRWIPGLQTAGPDQLQRSLEALTGHQALSTPGETDCAPYCPGQIDLLLNEERGYFSLLGGVDGGFNQAPLTLPTPSQQLAWSRLSAEAAREVVERDLAEPDPARRTLLTQIVGDETGGAPIEAQLGALSEHLLSLPPAEDEIAELVDLFQSEIRRSGDPASAWRLIVTALLRDPAFLHY